MDRNYDVITFFQNSFSSKLLPYLLKQSFKTREKLNELEVMYENAIYICTS